MCLEKENRGDVEGDVESTTEGTLLGEVLHARGGTCEGCSHRQPMPEQ